MALPDFGISENLNYLLTSKKPKDQSKLWTSKSTINLSGSNDVAARQAADKASQNYYNSAQGGAVLGSSTSKSSGSSASPKSSPLGSSLLEDSKKSQNSFAKQQEKEKKAYKNLMEEKKKQYGKRYGQLADMIESRRPQAEADKASAIESVNAELTNLISKGDLSKQDANAYYDTTKSDIATSHEDANKELARIFQSRNATDSSYFMDKLMKSNSEFEKTLANLGGEQARKISEIDADMTYYQQQSISKKTEIEKAYNETIRAINEDLTKTGWEKEDAISNLENEFQSKMSAIDDKILNYSLQQQQFRQQVSQWAYDETYKTDKSGDYASEQDSILKSLQKSAGNDGKADPELFAALRASSKLSADQFNKKYGYLLSGQEQSNLGLSSGNDNNAFGLSAEELNMAKQLGIL